MFLHASLPPRKRGPAPANAGVRASSPSQRREPRLRPVVLFAPERASGVQAATGDAREPAPAGVASL